MQKKTSNFQKVKEIIKNIKTSLNKNLIEFKVRNKYFYIAKSIIYLIINCGREFNIQFSVYDTKHRYILNVYFSGINFHFFHLGQLY